MLPFFFFVQKFSEGRVLIVQLRAQKQEKMLAFFPKMFCPKSGDPKRRKCCPFCPNIFRRKSFDCPTQGSKTGENAGLFSKNVLSKIRGSKKEKMLPFFFVQKFSEGRVLIVQLRAQKQEKMMAFFPKMFCPKSGDPKRRKCCPFFFVQKFSEGRVLIVQLGAQKQEKMLAFFPKMFCPKSGDPKRRKCCPFCPKIFRRKSFDCPTQGSKTGENAGLFSKNVLSKIRGSKKEKMLPFLSKNFPKEEL